MPVSEDGGGAVGDLYAGHFDDGGWEVGWRGRGVCMSEAVAGDFSFWRRYIEIPRRREMSTYFPHLHEFGVNVVGFFICAFGAFVCLFQVIKNLVFRAQSRYVPVFAGIHKMRDPVRNRVLRS